MTHDPVLREAELAQAFLTYGAAAIEAHCPDCDRLLAVYVEDATAVLVPLYSEEPYIDEPYNRESGRSGFKVLLAEEFTNRGARHPSGRPWYHQGRSRRREPLRVRVPAVVTCRGIDVALPTLITDVDREFATGPTFRKRRLWEDIEGERSRVLYEFGIWEDAEEEPQK